QEPTDGGLVPSEQNLKQRLDGTPIPARDAARLIETLARAVHQTHQRGIVYCNLKPANVLLTFGVSAPPGERPLNEAVPRIAGLGEPEPVLGTPSYLAPEQAAGRVSELGPQSDVYALGAILYECLTGRPPFQAATPLETLEQVCNQEPVPPSRLQPKTPPD